VSFELIRNLCRDMEIKEINEKIRSKKVIIFDLDKTLARSKLSIDGEMAEILSRLLERYKISIITGGRLEQLKEQVVDHLDISPDLISNLYLQPTSGSALYVWDKNNWNEVYNEKIPEAERDRIIKTLEQAILDSGVEIPKEVYGERIEDRESQITFSALGQDALPEVKGHWDPDLKKREKIQEILQPRLPEYEVAIGGMNSIDINKNGLNKGFGVVQLSEKLTIPIEDMLFIGDRLEPGGNDHSVVDTGIDWIDVLNVGETKDILHKLLN
jgi:phosphomannomutase